MYLNIIQSMNKSVKKDIKINRFDIIKNNKFIKSMISYNINILIKGLRSDH